MLLLNRLPSRIRLIVRITLIAAVVGAFYGRSASMMAGDPLMGFEGVVRGALTGVTIAGILASFEVVILAEPIGAPLRQASFPVHVTVKSVIYLVVILFALA